LGTGNLHTCAVLESGAVKCWGENRHGGLGDRTTATRPSPVDVIGLEGVKTVSLGQDFSCALLENGGVDCWGDGSGGYVGDGRKGDSPVPSRVANLATVAALTAGTFHACALHGDGSVRCWGSSGYGLLGRYTESQNTPVAMANLPKAVAISASLDHDCIE